MNQLWDRLKDQAAADLFQEFSKLCLPAKLTPLICEAEKQSKDDTSCILVDLRKYPRQVL